MARAIYLAAGVVAALWFLEEITLVVMFFLLAVILALAMNPPVTWLEERRVPRLFGAMVVSLLILGVAGVLFWLVFPVVMRELTTFLGMLPEYIALVTDRLSRTAAEVPGMERSIPKGTAFLSRIMPAMQVLVFRIGQVTLSVAGFAVFGLLLASTVFFMVVKPKPLLESYVRVMPDHMREPAIRAFVRSSEMVTRWMWSNVIVGGISGVASAVFLLLLGVPGAILWGLVAFFAELVPKLGPYLMSVPPIIVALAISPWLALWVTLFYIALNLVTGDFVAPLVRSQQMRLHPVSLIFAVLAMAAAFGIMGALIATPVAGIVKAYYDELYMARRRPVHGMEEHVQTLLHGYKGDIPAEPATATQPARPPIDTAAESV